MFINVLSTELNTWCPHVSNWIFGLLGIDFDFDLPRHLACDFEGRAILSGVIKLALLMINNDPITKSRARITYLFYVFCFIFSL